MKTSTGFFTLLAAAALMAAGCKDDDPAYLEVEPGAEADKEVGYLTATDLGLRVVVDTDTETMPDDTAGETEQPAALSTRAGVDTDAFLVDIVDAQGAAVYSGTYGELAAELAQGPKELPVGGYTMRVRSEASMPGAAWNHPVYGGEKSFAIAKGETETIGEIRCTLQNIKVTLEVSADLADRFTDDTAATVSLGANSLQFPVRGGAQAGYFLPAEEFNTLHFALNGTFAATQSPVQFTKNIANVKAGQWRKITLVVTYADKGGVKFDVSVDSFVQSDDPIVINGTAYVWEQIYTEQPLVEKPTLVGTDHDLSEPLRLTAAMFDENNRCTEPFDFVLTAPGLIDRVEVGVESTDPALLEALEAASITQGLDLCSVEPGHPAYTLLSALGLPLGAELRGAESRTFSLGAAMPLLYNRPGYAGTHTFTVTVTDAEGQSAEFALTVIVGGSGEQGEPSIVWEGYEFDAQTGVAEAVVTPGLQVEITVKAPAGIRSLVVNIDSETLTPADLESLNLAATFDLADVSDPELADALASALEFPINDEVRNRTEVLIPIKSEFVSLLGGLPGEHRFHLTLTDNNGAEISKTVLLIVE